MPGPGRTAERAARPSTLRVLHLYRRFHPDFTGDGIYYQQLIPIMRSQGSIHDVLAFGTPAPSPQEMREGTRYDDYNVYYLTDGATPASVPKLLGWLLRRARDYDIVHIHSHVDRYFLSYLLARLLGWRVIFSCTLEDSPSHLLASYRAQFRRPTRWLMRLIDVFVAISPRLLDGITAVFPAGRSLLIPQGVRLPDANDRSQRQQARRALALADDDIVLLYVGSISARKSVAFLVEQMAELRHRYPRLKLIVVGPALEQAYAERVFALVERLGLREAVDFVGYQDNPKQYYLAGDIFVFASESEGFGNVLLEAMSFGMPVVARFLDGVTEFFVEHTENGFLFTDADEYRALISDLIERPDLRRTIGQSAIATVRRFFALESIADRYGSLYQRLLSAPAAASFDPESPYGTSVSGCRSLDAGPAAAGMRPVAVAADQPPILNVVIDTEAEFDWDIGVADDKGAVTAIMELWLAQRVFDEFGVHPCYVVDYPVASHPESAAVLRQMHQHGAEIGAHLQPWTTPPIVEPRNAWHAFPGNLSRHLERQKLKTLKAMIEQSIGVSPVVYKAGRYGLSRGSLDMLEELRFEIDLSVGSSFDFSPEGGPNYARYGASPYVFGERRQLLELPTTGGFVGALRNFGPMLWRVSENEFARRIHLRGALDRTHALSRMRLSPEGYGIEHLVRLTQELLQDGVRVFTLSFHSSSLKPGFTPYVRNARDLERLLDTMRQYFAFFLRDLGGVARTPTETKRLLLGEGAAVSQRESAA